MILALVVLLSQILCPRAAELRTEAGPQIAAFTDSVPLPARVSVGAGSLPAPRGHERTPGGSLATPAAIALPAPQAADPVRARDDRGCSAIPRAVRGRAPPVPSFSL